MLKNFCPHSISGGILCRYEWPKLVIAFASIVSATLSIGSTLEVNKEPKILALEEIYLAALEVIFDGSSYPIQCGVDWDNRCTYTSQSRDNRYQRAAIAIFYSILAEKLKKLSDRDFFNFLKAPYFKRSHLFDPLMKYIYKEFL
ncbi:hypothetical protein B1F79_03585, partial [Coxiella-like endosymbiont of Rhipicephalus sanguineus]|nr:hypothetical protein [Coxiella-like endosymbiont of Rhipicephalus sanguineus]